MKASVESWLNGVPKDAGIVAVGIRHPGLGWVADTNSSGFTADQWNAIWNPIQETMKAFNMRRLAARRLQWKFDQHSLALALREDELILGVLTWRDGTANETHLMKDLLRKFDTLILDPKQAA